MSYEEAKDALDLLWSKISDLRDDVVDNDELYDRYTEQMRTLCDVDAILTEYEV